MKINYDFKNTYLMYFHEAKWIPLNYKDILSTINGWDYTLEENIPNIVSKKKLIAPKDPENYSDSFVGTTLDTNKWRITGAWIQDEGVTCTDATGYLDFRYRLTYKEDVSFKIKVDISSQEYINQQYIGFDLECSTGEHEGGWVWIGVENLEEDPLITQLSSYALNYSGLVQQEEYISLPTKEDYIYFKIRRTFSFDSPNVLHFITYYSLDDITYNQVIDYTITLEEDDVEMYDNYLYFEIGNCTDSKYSYFTFEREKDTSDYLYINQQYLGSTPFYYYNYTTDAWTAFTYDEDLIGTSIINNGYNLGEEGRKLDIIGWADAIYYWGEYLYTSYLFNVTNKTTLIPTDRTSYNDSIEQMFDDFDDSGGLNTFGERYNWSYSEWEEGATQPVDSHFYFNTKYYFKDIDNNYVTDTIKVKLKDDTVIINSTTADPIVVQNIQNEILPETYTFKKVAVDYEIENETDNNSIEMRLVDENGYEYLYSEDQEEWQYMGQSKGEFDSDSTEYQTLEKINQYISYFTTAKTLGFRLKVTSDENNVTINSVSFYLDETVETSNRVLLYGYLYNINGDPENNMEVRIRSTEPQNTSYLTKTLDNSMQTTTTNSNGFFMFEVLPNIEIELLIKRAGIRKNIQLSYNDVDLGEITF